MDYSELKRLAEEATAGPWKFSQKWADHIDAEDGDICMLTDNLFSGFTRPLLDRRNNATYIAAASPDVVLGLLAEVEKLQSNIDERTGGVVRLMTERDTLRTQNQALLQALTDAARSLETISKLAGRHSYGNPPIQTFMDTFGEVRGYASSRAGVAFDAIKLAEGKDV